MQNGVQTENCSCGEMRLTQKVDGYFTSKNERRTNSGKTEARYSTPVECADVIQDLIWSRIRRSAARFPVRAAKTDRDDSSFQKKKKKALSNPRNAETGKRKHPGHGRSLPLSSQWRSDVICISMRRNKALVLWHTSGLQLPSDRAAEEREAPGSEASRSD